MNNDFLKQVRQGILSRETPLRDQIVVLPTRRAGAHLKASLVVDLYEASWLPDFKTFNQWMEEISGLKSVDPLHLKFACFKVYQEVMGASAQDISAFFSWADVLLGDFNDIEAYLVSPDNIFKALKDYTDIAHFSFLEDPLSTKQMNYQKFWKALPLIHKKLNGALLAEGLGYAGLIARKAAENWDAWAAEKGAFFATIAGFNAISAAEAALLSKAQKSGKAEILFDVDAFYFDQKANHAGIFLRRNAAANLGKNIFTPVSLGERELDIYIGEASSRARQISHIAALLAEVPENELSDTAVVLADESLLTPLLNQLPENIRSVNVTMGIGLRDTIFADWLRAIWEMHETGLYTEGQFHFSAERLKKVLNHPVSQLLQESPETDMALPAADQLKFIPSLQATREATTAGIAWFVPLLEAWNHNSLAATNSLLTSLEKVEGVLLRKGVNTYTLRIIWESTKLVQRALKKMISIEGIVDLRPAASLTLVLRELGSGSLALIGEPLEGLQVMGLLETRALAYKHVIMCSANEDILPQKARIDSFIPFEIRQYHHLPGKREKEAVYAYHFYRLMQHAQKVQYVYSADSLDQRANEKSRYLHQIGFELAAQNPHIKLTQIFLEPDPLDILESKLEIKKTTEVLSQIRKVVETKLSASSINKYLDSPLEWYYTYVLKLSEPEKDGELDPATFGTIVHDTLDNLKKQVLNEIVTPGLIDQMLADVKAEVKRQFELHPISRQYALGLNKVHFEVAIKMVRRYLKSEKSLIQEGEEVIYLNSELELFRKLKCQVLGQDITAQFTGSADSVENRNGVKHIIDYKTGMVRSSDLSLTAFEMEKIAVKPKALQLLLYTWMAKENYPGEEIRSQIITLPSPSNRSLIPKMDVNSPEGEAEFERMLRDIIEHMLDPAIPIAANKEFRYAVFEP